MKIGIITPVNRYLGFSAPISPVEQFNKSANNFNDIELEFIDPQKAYIETGHDNLPQIFNEYGSLANCDVYFPFGHTLLDRNMTKYLVLAAEIAHKKVVNGYRALTMGDDKALLALSLSNSGLPLAKSIIASARGNVDSIIEKLDQKTIISKISGFSAGGVGVKPLRNEIDYLAPELWMARMDEKPRVLQNDLELNREGTRSVIRAYVVGGRVVGCYTTSGLGIVNCAGLTRESVAKHYKPTNHERRVFVKAASAVGASGYCRVDAINGENFAIIEVNPLARIDADSYGIDVSTEILKFAVRLGEKE